MSSRRPRFLLTENLNRLAKWLRLLGYDAALFRSISFSNMKRIADRERRKILTRAKAHLEKGNNDIILIRSEDHKEQIKEIRALLSLEKEFLFTRCLNCNKILYEMDKDNIKDSVPAYVFETQTEFKVCRKCGGVFWQGTHYIKMMKTIREIFN